MNVKLTQDLREVFEILPPAEWHDLFERMRQQEYGKLHGSPTQETLTALPIRVNLLDELEEFFLRARQTKTTEKQ